MRTFVLFLLVPLVSLSEEASKAESALSKKCEETMGIFGQAETPSEPLTPIEDLLVELDRAKERDSSDLSEPKSNVLNKIINQLGKRESEAHGALPKLQELLFTTWEMCKATDYRDAKLRFRVGVLMIALLKIGPPQDLLETNKALRQIIFEVSQTKKLPNKLRYHAHSALQKFDGEPVTQWTTTPKGEDTPIYKEAEIQEEVALLDRAFIKDGALARLKKLVVNGDIRPIIALRRHLEATLSLQSIDRRPRLQALWTLLSILPTDKLEQLVEEHKDHIDREIAHLQFHLKTPNVPSLEQLKDVLWESRKSRFAGVTFLKPKQNSSSIQSGAVHMLAELGGPEAIKLLIKALDFPDSTGRVNKAAFMDLIRLNEARFSSALISATHEIYQRFKRVYLLFEKNDDKFYEIDLFRSIILLKIIGQPGYQMLEESERRFLQDKLKSIFEDQTKVEKFWLKIRAASGNTLLVFEGKELRKYKLLDDGRLEAQPTQKEIAAQLAAQREHERLAKKVEEVKEAEEITISARNAGQKQAERQESIRRLREAQNARPTEELQTELGKVKAEINAKIAKKSLPQGFETKTAEDVNAEVQKLRLDNEAEVKKGVLKEGQKLAKAMPHILDQLKAVEHKEAWQKIKEGLLKSLNVFEEKSAAAQVSAGSETKKANEAVLKERTLLEQVGDAQRLLSALEDFIRIKEKLDTKRKVDEAFLRVLDPFLNSLAPWDLALKSIEDKTSDWAKAAGDLRQTIDDFLKQEFNIERIESIKGEAPDPTFQGEVATEVSPDSPSIGKILDELKPSYRRLIKIGDRFIYQYHAGQVMVGAPPDPTKKKQPPSP